MIPGELIAEMVDSVRPRCALSVVYALDDFYTWRSWYGDRVSLECLE